ncbi:MAG: hypothetical protein J5548_01120 [Prevotella sp.]|nr:hypothetical protein [Prevotella sp.]
MSRFIKIQLLMMLLAVASLNVAAQGHNRFNPAKFKADLERFITVEACLTPREAAAFFPLYDEMNNKQRVLYDKMRELRRMKPIDEERCKKVIAEIDQLEIEIKQLQSNYHARFLSIISASKLFDVIKAESKFHRQAMRNAANPWHR